MADPLSPELVLVDPILSAAAREDLASYDGALPDLFESLERKRAAEAALPRPDLHLAETSAANEPPTGRSPPEPLVPVVGTVERAEHAPSRRWAVAAGLALLAVAVAATGAVRLAQSADSHVASSEPQGVQPSTRAHAVAKASSPAETSGKRRVGDKAKKVRGVSAPRSTTTTGSKQATARPSDRHLALPSLAWKRTPRATFYRVRISRLASGGSWQTFLFEVWTRQRRLVLPRSWVAGGRRHLVGPGTYRWYVFPVFDASSPGGGIQAARSIAHGTVVVTR